MRLFHVSEEHDIGIFYPRLPSRKDLDPGVGLVWAISEEKLPNFLTPRNCPRVCFHDHGGASEADRAQYLEDGRSCVAVEKRWRRQMENTTLYLYEFDPAAFALQDECAGYYVATTPQTPIARHVITNPLRELEKRNVHVCFEDELFTLAEAIKKTTLHWSLCRMGYAVRPGEDAAAPADKPAVLMQKI